jgi:hypothetical protein
LGSVSDTGIGTTTTTTTTITIATTAEVRGF